MTTIKVRKRRRLPRINLQDLEAEDPEVIPLKVPSGLVVEGHEYRFKVKPFAHQMAALRRAKLLNGGAMFMEQGTGKTAVAIHFIATNYISRGRMESNGKSWSSGPDANRSPSFSKALIICPVSTMGVWVKEIVKHLPQDVLSETTVYRLHGSRKTRINKIRAAIKKTGLRICILNYESSWRLEDWIDRYSPDIVIIDESHRIKSARAKQSKAMWRIGFRAPKRLALTGTPIISGVHDLWSQWNFIDKKVFGDSWWRFQQEYLIKGGYLLKEIIGYRNLDTLKKKVRQNSFVITKEECLDLPEKIFQVIPVTLTSKSKKLYNEMAEKLVAEIEEGKISTAPIVLVKLLRLSQITGGFIKDLEGDIYDIGSEKLDICTELVEDRVGDGHKVVVFARFRHEISRVAEELSKVGIESLVLTGSVKPIDRDDLIDQFQSPEGPPVFISQIQAGSLGITLTAANTAIFYSRDYSLGNYLQAVDRLHRIGQTSKVTYLCLIVPHSIDEIVHQNLKSKEELARFILKKPRAILLKD